MDAGSTFLVAKKEVDDHLWIVASDPQVDADHVLIVNMTTLNSRKEQACLIEAGEHPWVRHRTCINYEDSKIVSLDKLRTLKNCGLIAPQEPLAPRLLQRVRAGAAVSKRIPLDNKNVLVEQGLIPG
jgi:hypothetical protein